MALWRAEADPLVLRATARQARTDDIDIFDLMALPMTATILRDRDGPEHVLLADGPRHVRLQLRGDSLVEGPVCLSYDLEGLHTLDPAILGLRRLSAIGRLGRLPRALFPPDPIVARRVRALQAWDGDRAGASQRDIALAVFGRHMVTEANFYSMRDRVYRLLKKADRCIAKAQQRFFAE